jgi:CO/xanthine dehydrogenase FAD-binding subunit
MDFIQPAAWADALHAKAENPDAVPIAGGTDLMVGLNFGGADQRGRRGGADQRGSRGGADQRDSSGGADQRRNSGGPQYEAMLDLSRVAELSEWSRQDGVIRLGAGVTYSRIIDELGAACPGLAAASRTVGSPQIRNRGTVAGNLGTASPAGDAHPPLRATGAVVEAA